MIKTISCLHSDFTFSHNSTAENQCWCSLSLPHSQSCEVSFHQHLSWLPLLWPRARFIQAVSELQFLGFIKPTKRKTDHVARLTWGGCWLGVDADLTDLGWKLTLLVWGGCWPHWLGVEADLAGVGWMLTLLMWGGSYLAGVRWMLTLLTWGGSWPYWCGVDADLTDVGWMLTLLTWGGCWLGVDTESVVY